MAKRHEEMAREFLESRTSWGSDEDYDGAEKELAALLARVEREAIERAEARVLECHEDDCLAWVADRIHALLEDGDA